VAGMIRDDDPASLAYLAEGNAKQARKRVAAKLVIRNTGGQILLVNPSYKDYWDIPGGMAEANESPRAAARRELREELSYRPNVGHLLHLEWIDAHGPWDDHIVFIFDGGTLHQDDVERLHIADGEILEFGFFDVRQAADGLLRSDVGEQLLSAHHRLDTNETSYRER
jgi:ADP-ribose pyrophosphatase YjhB (NUDIX family)